MATDSQMRIDETLHKVRTGGEADSLPEVLTDENVQDILAKAITAVTLEINDEKNRNMQNELALSQLSIIQNLFITLRFLAKTSNGIIGLRGLGLKEGVALAQEVVAGNVKPQNLNLNLRVLFSGIA